MHINQRLRRGVRDLGKQQAFNSTTTVVYSAMVLKCPCVCVCVVHMNSFFPNKRNTAVSARKPRGQFQSSDDDYDDDDECNLV